MATLLDVHALGLPVGSQVSSHHDLEAFPEVIGCQLGAIQQTRIEKTASRTKTFRIKVQVFWIEPDVSVRSVHFFNNISISKTL